MKIIPILLLTFLFLSFLAPTVFAGDTGIAQLSGCTGLDCSACNVVSMANGLIIWLVGILFVVFALLLAIAGVRLVTSGGNHHALDEAKSSFMNAIIGFIIILAAWLIVDTIMRGLVGRPGQEGMIGGEATGWLFWSEIECSDQRLADTIEVDQEDVAAIPLYSDLSDAPGWTYVPPTGGGGSGGGGGDMGGGPSGTTYTASCTRLPGPANEVSQFDCTNQRAQCTAIGGRATIIQSGRVLSCLVPPGAGGGTIPTGIVTNSAMRPIFDPAQGGSSMVREGAAARMQQTLAGPFARLQQYFGRSIMINDAIAKAGTSRERNTPNSQHFYGTALDLSTTGMSDADKIRLYEMAKRAGFTGFGFGANILHVDLGPSRGWAYGNSTYGGRSVSQLISSV